MDIFGNISAEKKKSLEVAEEARQSEWLPSFAAELFAGRFVWDMAYPYPEQSDADKKIGDEFMQKLEVVLKQELDADEIDETGLIPQSAYEALARLGCFSMKIPKEYGGMGFSQVNYNRAMALVTSYCGSTAVMLSAHQSIGVPQPLKLFGTKEQKEKYLTRFAKNVYISAFALTEVDVGSDPAQMKTMAKPTEDGAHYLISGEKLWCTNGPIADIMVVMAQTPPKVVKGKERKQITAFLVEKDMPGVEVVHRCRFMGLHGIQNGLLRFTNVKVPKENIILAPGRGLKLALVTLNTGRLTVPACTTAGAKFCLRVVRKWASKREQWGAAIGKHEAVTSKIAYMSAATFAMDSVTWYVSNLSDANKTDMRLEAAISKLFCTEAAWRIADDTVQIRGGRGYETANSLKARGEEPIPAERMLRDMRINLIIEGTSDIMHLFIAREAMDPHFKLAMPIFGGNAIQKVMGILKATFFYAIWYPKLWLWPNRITLDGVPQPLHGHLRYVERASRRVARALFHGMMRYQQKLERKQKFLFRLVEIGTDLFAMASSISRASQLAQRGKDTSNAVELCDLFCQTARQRSDRKFKVLFKNDDVFIYRVGRNTCEGKYAWLEEGIRSE